MNKQQLRTLAQEAAASHPITHCRTGRTVVRGRWEDRIRMTREELGIGQPRPVTPPPVPQPAASDPVLYQLALLLRQAGII